MFCIDTYLSENHKNNCASVCVNSFALCIDTCQVHAPGKRFKTFMHRHMNSCIDTYYVLFSEIKNQLSMNRHIRIMYRLI